MNKNIEQSDLKMLFWRWLGVMLLTYTTVEIFFLFSNHVPDKAYLLAAGGTSILVGHILYPENTLTSLGPYTKSILWSFLLSFGVFLLLSLQGSLQVQLSFDAWLFARLSFGVLLLSFVLRNVTHLIQIFASDSARAASIVLLLGIFITAIPLWLGPFTDQYIESQAATNTVISLSPLTYLAVLTEYDYLRSSWFYSHTPFGELRYEYPSALFLSVLYLLLGVLTPLLGKSYLPHNNHKELYT